MALRLKGSSVEVFGGGDTLEEAQRVFRSAAEKFFGETLLEFFQGCAVDFNGDDPKNNHYTGEELLSDRRGAFETLEKHGFDIAKHIGRGQYLADETTRTL